MLTNSTLTYVGLALALTSWVSICYLNILASSSSDLGLAVYLKPLVEAWRRRSGAFGGGGGDEDAKQVKYTFIGDEELKATMERIQSDRQRTLRAACAAAARRPPRPAYETVWPTFGRTFNVRSLGLTYCAVAKCATTTFKGFLAKVTGNPCYADTYNPACSRNLTRPRSFGHFERRSLLIVRNPWSRLVSSYWNKFVVERHPLAAPCYERHRKPLHDRLAITFAEYVDCVLNDYRQKVPLNVHFAPMHWHCSPCLANYTYIAHLETFKDDFKYLSRYAFPNSTSQEEYDRAIVATELRKNEASNMTTASYFDCYRSLSQTTINDLVNLYKADAEYYGYPTNPL